LILASCLINKINKFYLINLIIYVKIYYFKKIKLNNFIYLFYLIFYLIYFIIIFINLNMGMGIGDWGFGIGDWGLGFGD